MIVTLSSIGLPGLNGFVGEFLILLGTFRTNVFYAVFAATGVVLAAVYMLWMFQRVMFGEVTNPKNKNLPDMTKRELVVLLPVVIFIIWIGVYPKPFLKPMEASVNGLIKRVEQRVQLSTSREDDTLTIKSSSPNQVRREPGRVG
jgi:NADH-quinone oxidoreductase subunit M